MDALEAASPIVSSPPHSAGFANESDYDSELSEALSPMSGASSPTMTPRALSPVSNPMPPPSTSPRRGGPQTPRSRTFRLINLENKEGDATGDEGDDEQEEGADDEDDVSQDESARNTGGTNTPFDGPSTAGLLTSSAQSPMSTVSTPGALELDQAYAEFLRSLITQEDCTLRHQPLLRRYILI